MSFPRLASKPVPVRRARLTCQTQCSANSSAMRNRNCSVRLIRLNPGAPDFSGCPLFFFPGMDGTGQSILPQMSQLAEAGLDVNCLYIPTEDRSSWEELTSTTERLVLDALRSSKSTKALFVAESFGACLALRLALKVPHVFDNLVILNPATSFNISLGGLPTLISATNLLGVFPEAWYRVAQTILLPLLVNDERVGPEGKYALEQMIFMKAPAALDESVLASYSNSSVASRLGFGYAPAAAAQHRVNLLREGSITAQELTQINVRTVVLASARDRLFPSLLEGSRLQRMMPQAKRLILPDSCHAALLEKSTSLVDILRRVDMLPKAHALSHTSESATDSTCSQNPSGPSSSPGQPASVPAPEASSQLSTSQQPGTTIAAAVAATAAVVTAESQNDAAAAAATTESKNAVQISSSHNGTSSSSSPSSISSSSPLSSPSPPSLSPPSSSAPSPPSSAAPSSPAAAAVPPAPTPEAMRKSSPSLLAATPLQSPPQEHPSTASCHQDPHPPPHQPSQPHTTHPSPPHHEHQSSSPQSTAPVLHSGLQSLQRHTTHPSPLPTPSPAVNLGLIDKVWDDASQFLAPWRDLVSPLVLGTEHLPPPQQTTDRPILFVGNHQKMGLYDMPLLMYELYVRGFKVKGLAHPGHWSSPLGSLFERFGAVKASPRAAYRLLRNKEKILLFPGGAKEVNKPRELDYQLLWQDTPDFVRLAARFNTIIIPFAAVGADDAYDVAMEVNEMLNDSVLGPLLTSALKRVDPSLVPEEALLPLTRLPGVGIPSLIPVPNLQRLYFKFCEPVDTKLMKQEGAEVMYERVKGEVEGAIRELLEVRAGDREVQLGARLESGLRKWLPLAAQTVVEP